jgi:hypothetical protein
VLVAIGARAVDLGLWRADNEDATIVRIVMLEMPLITEKIPRLIQAFVRSVVPGRRVEEERIPINRERLTLGAVFGELLIEDQLEIR